MKTLLPLLSFLLLVLNSASCVPTGDAEVEKTSDQNMGTFELKLTDAPLALDTVQSTVVTFSEISIRSREGGFTTISTEQQHFDVLQLRNGLTETLSKVSLPEGTYDHVRVIIDEANITLKDGYSQDLKVPSGDKSGLKIFFSNPIHIVAGKLSSVILDFDLTKSFIQTGKKRGPKFILKPVIRAITEFNPTPPIDDDSDAGDSDSGDSDSGDSDSGDSDSGDSDSGDSDSGDSDSGDSDSGDSDSGDSDSGDSDSGDSDSGDSDSGNTDSGDTGSGDTGSGDTGSGDTGSGDTGSGDTGSGDSDNDQSPTDGSEVTGTVTDENGDPLADITIIIFDTNEQIVASTISDANGNYKIIGLNAGEYYLDSFSSFTNRYFSDLIVLDGSSSSTINIQLIRN